jgi:hypothetical protein
METCGSLHCTSAQPQAELKLWLALAMPHSSLPIMLFGSPMAPGWNTPQWV